MSNVIQADFANHQRHDAPIKKEANIQRTPEDQLLINKTASAIVSFEHIRHRDPGDDFKQLLGRVLCGYKQQMSEDFFLEAHNNAIEMGLPTPQQTTHQPLEQAN